VIEISNVTKRFYPLTALNRVTLRIPQGEVLGLLGPNGAGKTTLFKLVAGLLMPDEGKITPFGGRWPAIGYKPERLLFPNHLRVVEYLELVARLCNIAKADVQTAVTGSLARVNLLDASQKRIRNCSKGMRQRLALAQVLIGDPPLILLDEPSNGLDPEGQAEIHRCIRALHAAGKTIVMSTHHLHEVTEVCTQLVILNRGRVHYQSSMSEALTAKSHAIIQANRELSAICGALTALHPDITIEGDRVFLEGEAVALRRQVLMMLLHANYDVLRVHQKRATLAEIYAEAVQ